MLIVSRLLQFAAVIVVFGCGAFRLYGLAFDTTTTSANALVTFDTWVWRVTIVGAIVALLSGVSLLLAVTANMAGSAAAALDPNTISTVLFDTSFGLVWCWRLLFAFLLIGACLAPLARRRMPAILVLSLLLLVSLGWVGHAVEGQGVARFVHQINQMVHLLAAGLWLGGLVPLTWLLGRARSPSGAAWISVARDVVPRFSHMGYVAVALLAATGAINTLLLVGSVEALAGTPYGRLLSLKILLFFGDGRSCTDQSLPPAAAPSPRTAAIGSARRARALGALRAGAWFCCSCRGQRSRYLAAGHSPPQRMTRHTARSRKHLFFPCQHPERPVSSERNYDVIQIRLFS
jgi:putative copper resistance protein D